MALTSNKITSFTFLHQNQLDFPNASFPSSLAFKQAIDTQAQQCQTAINGTIDNLVSTTPGNSGSENIGAAPIPGVSGATVAAQITNLSQQIIGAVTPPVSVEMSRQAIINGNFDVWQHGTSFLNPFHTAITADKYFAAFLLSGGQPTSIIHSRLTLTPGDIAGSYWGYRVNVNSAGTFGADDVYSVQQRIDNGTQYLCGDTKKVTLSFYAKSDIVGKRIGIFLGQSYGTGGAPTATEILTGTTFTLSASWQRYSFTFTTNTLVGKTFGTNNDNSLNVSLSYAWGTNLVGRFNTASTETFGAAGNIDIAQVQVSAGEVILPYMPKMVDQETIAVSADSLYNASMSRQAIMNGNFDIWQRGTSFTNPATNTFQTDRFRHVITNTGTLPTTITHSKQALITGDIPSSYFFYRITTNGAGSGFGATDGYEMQQAIENGTRFLCGQDKKLTISFYARSSIVGKKIGVRLQQTYGTGGAPSANEIIVGTTFNLTSTWTRYTLTLTTNTLVGKTFGTNNDDLVQLGIGHMWGTTTGSQRYGVTTAETFVGAGDIDIAQIQVCAGDVVLPFMPKTFDEELRACQRYYEKSYNDTVNPGTATVAGAITYQTRTAIAASTAGTLTIYIPFKVKKRLQPNMVFYSTDGTINAVGNVTAGTTRIGVTTSIPSETGIKSLAVSNASTSAISLDNIIEFQWVAEVDF